jgi:hypothetical protein
MFSACHVAMLYQAPFYHLIMLVIRFTEIFGCLSYSYLLILYYAAVRYFLCLDFFTSFTMLQSDIFFARTSLLDSEFVSRL